MKLEALRPLAAAFVALGFVLAFDAAPASAQERRADPLVHAAAVGYPPQTGPKIRKLPGSYGHTYRNRT